MQDKVKPETKTETSKPVKKGVKSAAPKTKPLAVATADKVEPTQPAVKREKKKTATKIKIQQKRIGIKLPVTEYSQLVALKKSCLIIGIEPKKSELVRAGLFLLEKLSPEELKSAISNLQKNKSLKLRS